MSFFKLNTLYNLKLHRNHITFQLMYVHSFHQIVESKDVKNFVITHVIYTAYINY